MGLDTLQEACELVQVSRNKIMEIFPGPHRENKDRAAHADDNPNGNGGEPPVSQLRELILPIARNSHQAKCQDEHEDAIVVPRLDLR